MDESNRRISNSTQQRETAAETAGIQMILGGITMLEIDHILAKQFALDYHCKPEDFNNSDTLVTE